MAAEIPNGAFLIARAILNSSLWTMRPEDCKLAVTLIGTANWKPKKWFDGTREIEIGRGQLVRSLASIAVESHLSLQTIRTSLKRLEKIGFLTRKSTSRYTLITIPKYDFYQRLGHYSDSVDTNLTQLLTQDQHALNMRLTRAQHAPNNKQEGKERKEGQEGKNKSAELGKTLASPPVIPDPLKGLPLYEQDKKLCRRWGELVPGWEAAYPGVDIPGEIRKAHAWELANPKKVKKDRARFLNNWLARQQDKPSYGNGRAAEDSAATEKHQQWRERMKKEYEESTRKEKNGN